MLEKIQQSGLKHEKPHQKKRIIVYQGARMSPTNDSYPDGSRTWSFPLFTPTQTNTGTPIPGEVSGGFARQEAVRKLYEKIKSAGEEVAVITTGGLEEDGSSRSDEAAKRLTETEGLAHEDVFSVGGMRSTIGNAQSAFKYIQDNLEEFGEVSRIEIVTNDFHMLRSWIIFSKEILRLTTDEDLDVKTEDKQLISHLLDDGSPKQNSAFDITKVRETREEVMEILEKYFIASGIQIIPIVAEEILDEGDTAEQRYANALRTNKWVIETIQYEYKGIIDILDKRYKSE